MEVSAGQQTPVQNPRCVCGRLWEPDEAYCAGCGKARNDPIQNDPAAARRAEGFRSKRDRRGGLVGRRDEWITSRSRGEDREYFNNRGPPLLGGASELDDERAAEAEAAAAREQLEEAERRRRAAMEARRAAESVLADPSSAQSLVPFGTPASFPTSALLPDPTPVQDSKSADARVVASLAPLSNPVPRTLPPINSRGRIDPSSSYDRPSRYLPRNDTPRRSPEALLDHSNSLLDRGGRPPYFDSSTRSIDYPNPRYPRSYDNFSRNNDRFYDGPPEPRSNARDFSSHAQLQEELQSQPQLQLRGLTDRQTPNQSQQLPSDSYSGGAQTGQRNGLQRIGSFDRDFNQLQKLNDAQQPGLGDRYGQLDNQANYYQSPNNRQQSQTHFSYQQTQGPPYGETQSAQYQAQPNRQTQTQQTPTSTPHYEHGTSQTQHGQVQNGQTQLQPYGQKYVESEPSPEVDVWADLPVYPA